jgi:zinc protease
MQRRGGPLRDGAESMDLQERRFSARFLIMVMLDMAAPMRAAGDFPANSIPRRLAGSRSSAVIQIQPDECHGLGAIIAAARCSRDDRRARPICRTRKLAIRRILMPRCSAVPAYVLVAVMAACLLVAPRPSAAAEPAPAAKSHTVQPIAFRLDNGLQVVLIPDHRAPVVTQSIWYKVGATDDPPHSHGLAHFLEHMMFKGTDKFPAGVFNQVVSRIGGMQNAVTTDSFTYYYQIIPKAHLAQIMEMEADRMSNLRMNESEVTSERTVILQERRGTVDDNYKRRLFIKAHKALYGGHALSTDIIGSQAEILSFSREDALAFYHRHYVPGNAVLVIAGDVSESELRGLLQNTYARIPAGPVPTDRPVLAPLPPLTRHAVGITDPHVGNPTAWLIYRIPGLQHLQYREAVALSVLSQIIGSDTGRLRKNLVLPGIGLEASSDLDTGFATRLVLGVNSADNASLAKVEEGMKKTIAELIDKGVTQEELDLERASYLAAEIYRLDYQSLLATKYGSALVEGMTLEELGQWLDIIKSISVEEINAVARKYLVDAMKVTAEAWPATTASTSASSPEADGADTPTEAQGAK